MDTVSETISALGGFSAVARLTGRKYGAVWNWAANNKFPANTFLTLQAELRRRDLSAPASLWGMAEPAEASA